MIGSWDGKRWSPLPRGMYWMSVKALGIPTRRKRKQRLGEEGRIVGLFKELEKPVGEEGQ